MDAQKSLGIGLLLAVCMILLALPIPVYGAIAGDWWSDAYSAITNAINNFGDWIYNGIVSVTTGNATLNVQVPTTALVKNECPLGDRKCIYGPEHFPEPGLLYECQDKNGDGYTDAYMIIQECKWGCDTKRNLCISEPGTLPTTCDGYPVGSKLCEDAVSYRQCIQTEFIPTWSGQLYPCDNCRQSGNTVTCGANACECADGRDYECGGPGNKYRMSCKFYNEGECPSYTCGGGVCDGWQLCTFGCIDNIVPGTDTCNWDNPTKCSEPGLTAGQSKCFDTNNIIATKYNDAGQCYDWDQTNLTYCKYGCSYITQGKPYCKEVDVSPGKGNYMFIPEVLEPGGITVDGTYIYILDVREPNPALKIKKYTYPIGHSGNLTAYLAVPTKCNSNPVDIAIDRATNSFIWIADYQTGFLCKINKTGEDTGTVVYIGADQIRGIGTYGSDIYIASVVNNIIPVVDSTTGNVKYFFVIGQRKDKTVNPIDIAGDGFLNYYVIEDDIWDTNKVYFYHRDLYSGKDLDIRLDEYPMAMPKQIDYFSGKLLVSYYNYQDQNIIASFNRLLVDCVDECTPDYVKSPQCQGDYALTSNITLLRTHLSYCVQTKTEGGDDDVCYEWGNSTDCLANGGYGCDTNENTNKDYCRYTLPDCNLTTRCIPGEQKCAGNVIYSCIKTQENCPYWNLTGDSCFPGQCIRSGLNIKGLPNYYTYMCSKCLDTCINQSKRCVSTDTFDIVQPCEYDNNWKCWRYKPVGNTSTRCGVGQYCREFYNYTLNHTSANCTSIGDYPAVLRTDINSLGTWVMNILPANTRIGIYLLISTGLTGLIMFKSAGKLKKGGIYLGIPVFASMILMGSLLGFLPSWLILLMIFGTGLFLAILFYSRFAGGGGDE